jgi:CheY-like chemotaxis protein
MPDLIAFPPLQSPTAEHPLAGLTVLAVEDSRYACEALRLLCQHSGARLRRADTLDAAHRHLRVYRPDVLIVDLGLPDGPGEGLIAELARRPGRPSVILGTSGDPLLAPAALAAGADGFLDKPLPGLAAFQAMILAQMPEQARLVGAGLGYRKARQEPALAPDPIALRDDLALADDILSNRPDGAARDYVSRFLSGVARSAHDRQLEDAAARLAQARRTPWAAADPGADARPAVAGDPAPAMHSPSGQAGDAAFGPGSLHRQAGPAGPSARTATAAPSAAGDPPVGAPGEGPAGLRREAELGRVARLVRARLAAGSPLWIEASPPARDRGGERSGAWTWLF